MGISNGTFQVSASTQTNLNLSLYALGNTTNGSSMTANASNLSFGGYGVATVGMYASSLYIDVPSQTNQNFSIYALGNTTQATSQTVNANALSFNALGAISAGASGGSIQFPYQTNETTIYLMRCLTYMPLYPVMSMLQVFRSQDPG